MQDENSNLSRISKLFADRDSLPTLGRAPEAATIRGDARLRCRRGRFLHAATLRADRCEDCHPLLSRCRARRTACTGRRSCHVALAGTEGSSLLWCSCSVKSWATQNVVADRGDLPDSNALLFGHTREISGALRVTFDGWVAMTGLASRVARLPERPYCSLAAVLSQRHWASRSCSCHLRRFPSKQGDAPWRCRSGGQSSILPIRTQLVRLSGGCRPISGSWVSDTWATPTCGRWGRCPTRIQSQARFFLHDFRLGRRGEHRNRAALHPRRPEIARRRGSAPNGWNSRGFQTRLLERRFDNHFRCQHDEPRLALCGFDSNPPRREHGCGGLCPSDRKWARRYVEQFRHGEPSRTTESRAAFRNSGPTSPRKRRRGARPIKTVLPERTKRTLAPDSTRVAGLSSPENRSPCPLWERSRAVLSSRRRSACSTTVQPIPT